MTKRHTHTEECTWLSISVWLMYVPSRQMGVSQKPSGVAGKQKERKANTPHPSPQLHLQPSIMLGQGRWGPRVNNFVRNCTTVVLLAGHRVLRRSCLNFSTSKLLRCPPICQLSQDSLPIRCYKKNKKNTFSDFVLWCFLCTLQASLTRTRKQNILFFTLKFRSPADPPWPQ